MLSRNTQARAVRGSVVMLMPAAVLVAIVLAALAVDTAVVEVRRRDLVHAAAAAAADASTAALSPESIRAGVPRVEADLARAVVVRSLVANGVGPNQLADVRIGPADRRVTVELHGTYRYVFSGAVPGSPRHFELRVSASALGHFRDSP